MKCPRCGAEMQRRKLKEHTFQYRCPKCGMIIGNKGQEEDDTYRQAYETVMGRAQD